MMNPLLQEFLGSLLRWLFTSLGAWLVAQGVITSDQSERFIAGAIIALITLGWSLWQKYKSRRKFVTALVSSKDSTERQVEATVKAGEAPSVTTMRNEVPQ